MFSTNDIRKMAHEIIDNGKSIVLEAKAHLASMPIPGRKNGEIIFGIEPAETYLKRMRRNPTSKPSATKTCSVIIPNQPQNKTIENFKKAFGNKPGTLLNILGYDEAYLGNHYGYQGKPVTASNGKPYKERKIILRVVKMGLAIDTIV